jgi:hypothetical protein
MLIQEEDFQAASDYDILHYLYCHTERSVYSAMVYSILGRVEKLESYVIYFKNNRIF